MQASKDSRNYALLAGIGASVALMGMGLYAFMSSSAQEAAEEEELQESEGGFVDATAAE